MYMYFLLCPLFDFFLYFSNDVEIESFTLLKKRMKKQDPALLVYSPGGPGPGTEAGSWILGRPCLGCIPNSVI